MIGASPLLNRDSRSAPPVTSDRFSPGPRTTITGGRRRIGFLLFDGVKALDFVGPAEVFVEANLGAGDYELVMISPDGRDVTTSVGSGASVHHAAEDAGEFDTVIIPGSNLPPRDFTTPELVAAATLLAARTRRLASICNGAYVLASMGVLDGRRATTHWKFAGEMARVFSRVRMEPDHIFIRDGNVYTSAGVAAGIDLALALVQEDLGVEAAQDVAKLLVVYMKRSGGQPQFSASLRARTPGKAIVRQVVELLESDPVAPHRTAELARRANVSPRHLTRLFRDEFGHSPREYLTSLRFDMARLSIESGHSVAAAARVSGWGSAESLRRVFVARLGVSPSEYRRRFLDRAAG